MTVVRVERVVARLRRGAPALVLATLCACQSGTTWSWPNLGVAPVEGAPGLFGELEPFSGAWAVVATADAPSPGAAVEQRAAGEKAQFNVALLTGVELAAGRIEVALQAVSGAIDQGGGLVWLAQGGEDYLIARWNPLEDNLRAYVVQDGVRTQLASVDVELAPGWHRLAVDFGDGRFTVELDGVERLRGEHAAGWTRGRVGLWTKADARTRFDDLTVRPRD